ncbi:MAG: hypothetical protein WDA47_04655 [Bacilli bacterium]
MINSTLYAGRIDKYSHTATSKTFGWVTLENSNAPISSYIFIEFFSEEELINFRNRINWELNELQRELRDKRREDEE